MCKPLCQYRGSGGLRPEGHDYTEEEQRLHELEEHQASLDGERCLVGTGWLPP